MNDLTNKTNDQICVGCMYINSLGLLCSEGLQNTCE